jgi:hypothetical protein
MWRTPPSHRGEGAALLAATREQGLEGVVGKRLDSRYEPGGRSGAWVKVKHTFREVFVIGGWLRADMGRSDRLGALLVGQREEDGRLRYVGKIGISVVVTVPVTLVAAGLGEPAAHHVPDRQNRDVEPDVPRTEAVGHRARNQHGRGHGDVRNELRRLERGPRLGRS